MDKSPGAFRTISEVSDWLETPAHVLRFWESRFTQLKPVKRAGGRRYYRPGDMALLGGIKKLLHDDGLTIRGVQKILREQGVRFVADLNPAARMPGDPGEDGGFDAADGGYRAAFAAVPAVTPRRLKPVAVPEAGFRGGAAGARDETGEAPMHEDATEAEYAPRPGASIVAMVAPGAEDRAADQREPGEVSADLRDLMALDQDVGAVPAGQADDVELEAEWASILAEEAVARGGATRVDAPAPVGALRQQEVATGRQPDLFSRPALRMPELRDESGEVPAGPPVAVLLRHGKRGLSLAQRMELLHLLNRMADLRAVMAYGHGQDGR